MTILRMVQEWIYTVSSDNGANSIKLLPFTSGKYLPGSSLEFADPEAETEEYFFLLSPPRSSSFLHHSENGRFLSQGLSRWFFSGDWVRPWDKYATPRLTYISKSYNQGTSPRV